MRKQLMLFLGLSCIISSTYCQVPQEKQDQRMETSTGMLQTVLQGRFDTFRSGSICSPLPRAEFQIMDQSVLYAWGIDYACGNGIIEQDQTRIPTDEEIDRTIEHFSLQNLPFMWWTSAKVLEARGFQFGGILTGIALDIAQGIPEKPGIPSDLKVEIIQSENDLRVFAELSASAFAMNANVIEQWFDLNHSIMKQGEQVYFLAYLQGVPVGTAVLSVSPSSAGIWNLATVPECRKQGVGAALVHAALMEAKRRQYDQVMAILMPKGMAWGLFAKLGFKAVCEFPFYLYGVAAGELEKKEEHSKTVFTPPGDPLLQMHASEVPFDEITSEETQAIIDRMFEIARGERGDNTGEKRGMVGLAAPQIGIGKRIVLVDIGFDRERKEYGTLMAYINPEISWYSDEIAEAREGCFSVDSRVWGIVPRSKAIRVKAFDRHGNPVDAEFTGFTARIFQHEVDHLNGIRFPDRVGSEGKLHWVEESEYSEYKRISESWSCKCPWSLWVNMKEGKPYSVKEVKEI